MGRFWQNLALTNDRLGRLSGVSIRGERLIRWFKILLIVALAVVLPGGGQTNAAQMEIVINLPAFSLYLYRDGVVVETYPIGIGSTVNPSQLGTTAIINEVHFPTYYPPDWYRKGLEPIPPGPDNPVGTRWLGLGFKGYGIHGTNQPWTIGTAASAGCIRMNNADVEALAELVGVGVPVTFMYETIETWRDPLSHRPLIRVYKDIYRQGTNHLQRGARGARADQRPPRRRRRLSSSDPCGSRGRASSGSLRGSAIPRWASPRDERCSIRRPNALAPPHARPQPGK